jgi:hypothetical protein
MRVNLGRRVGASTATLLTAGGYGAWERTSAVLGPRVSHWDRLMDDPNPVCSLRAPSLGIFTYCDLYET